MKKLLQIVH